VVIYNDWGIFLADDSIFGVGNYDYAECPLDACIDYLLSDQLWHWRHANNDTIVFDNIIDLIHQERLQQYLATSDGYRTKAGALLFWTGSVSLLPLKLVHPKLSPPLTASGTPARSLTRALITAIIEQKAFQWGSLPTLLPLPALNATNRIHSSTCV
jgi:hypothetical protein